MTDGRVDAQRRANRIRAFRAELDALAAEGVAMLSDEQRAAIARHHELLLARLGAAYDVDRSEAAGQLSRAMQLTAFFAAVTLTAAIYSLVSRFWGRLDLPAQATLLCLFPLSALVGVELSARRERTLYVASLFAIVAYGTFWLAAGVLCDTLNIPMNPAIVWAGVLFGMALALAYGLRLILGVALAALTVAVAGSVFQSAGVPWTSAFEHPELIMLSGFGVALLAPYLAMTNAGFAAAARFTGLGVGFLGLLGLASFGGLSLLPLTNRLAEAVYQAVTLVTSVSALAIGIRRRWNETVVLAAVVLTIFLLIRFFDWFWDSLPRYVFFLVLAAIAFAWLFALRRLRTRLAGA